MDKRLKLSYASWALYSPLIILVTTVCETEKNSLEAIRIYKRFCSISFCKLASPDDNSILTFWL